MMNLTPQQLEGRPKRVGTLAGKAVMELKTKGGLNMIVAPAEKGGGWETLGVGPHRAISRHIAEKNHKEIQWTALAKGDWVDPAHFEFLLPRYEAMTADFRRVNGDDE